MGGKISKKIGKTVLWTITALLVLDLLAAGLLFVPPIQDFAVRKITASLSEQWKTGIGIQSVRLTPALKICVKGLRMDDDRHNSMISAASVKGRLKGLSLNPLKLKFRTIEADGADVVLRKYHGDTTVNISAWARKFAHDPDSGPFELLSQKLTLTGSRFVYIDDDKRKVFATGGNPDIDYAFFELADITMAADDFKVKGDDVSALFTCLAFRQYGGFELTGCSGDFRICDTLLSFENLRMKTPNSSLDLDLRFSYGGWSAYSQFNDSIRMQASIRPTQLALCDIAAFVPSMKGMDNVIVLEARELDGCVNGFSVGGLYGGWGMGNCLHGDFAAEGITDFKKARFNVRLDSCHVNMPELSRFKLPGGRRLAIGTLPARFGKADVQLSFAGTASDFAAYAGAKTQAGDFYAALSAWPDKGHLHVNGHVKTPDLNMARITGADAVLGRGSLNLSVEGQMEGEELTAANMKTLTARISGDAAGMELCRYPVAAVHIEAGYADRVYSCSAEADDPNFDCDFSGSVSLVGETPAIRTLINMHRFNPGAIAAQMPAADTAAPEGLERVIASLQRNPSLQVGFSNFAVDITGSRPDNINGYLRCDDIHVSNRGKSIDDERIRLTAINRGKLHKFILSTRVLNATLETTCPLSSIADSLKAVADNFFPNLIPSQGPCRPAGTPPPAGRNEYLKLHVNTYRTQPVIELLLPDLVLSPNSAVEVTMGSDTAQNRLRADIPLAGYKHMAMVHNLSVRGTTAGGPVLRLTVSADSAVAILNNNRLAFKDIDVRTETRDNVIRFGMDWHSALNADSSHNSLLRGTVDASNPDDIVLNVRNSALCVKDMVWKFNDDNGIHFRRHAFDFDNVRISNAGSELAVNGTFERDSAGRMFLNAKNVDLSIVNPFLSGISFGGRLSANVDMETGKDRTRIVGKLLAADFAFNGEVLGHLFAVAGVGRRGIVGFSGGFFRRDGLFSPDGIADYTIRDFRREKQIAADIHGSYAEESGKLTVETSLHQFNIGFLSPFLESFSDYVSGDATGSLAYYSMPGKSYLDGDLTVGHAKMGIAALGTDYGIDNQHVVFNEDGIFFDRMELSDADGNRAALSGGIRHRGFKDMKIDLDIHTGRLRVLNLPKTSNSVFYGTGYVAGNVKITGDDTKLAFIGPDIRTLEGTKIVLRAMNAGTASQSDVIHFQTGIPGDTAGDALKRDYLKTRGKTPLAFDFTFDISNTTEIALLIESIGGTLNARTDGRIQLVYEDAEDLNLYGNLILHSGDFKVSLYDVVSQKFTLTPGGTIRFDGPLDDMAVNISACKSSKTNLSSIIPPDYLTGNGANVVVNACLSLNGPIMRRMEPSFSFDLPNSSSEVSNMFYSAIDTANKENLTKQFAYFMLTNNFMPQDMFSSSTGNIGMSGYSMFSSVVNSMLSSIMEGKKGSFGLTYNQATETSSAEYGVKANANLLKDRISFETNIGYYDDRDAMAQGSGAISNMYGDFTFISDLNESGTLKFKAYTYLGERNDKYYLHEDRLNYTAGVALVFKHEFDSVRRKPKAKAVRRAQRRAGKPRRQTDAH